MLSKIAAMPCPPPMHMVTSARRPPMRFNSYSALIVRTQPVALINPGQEKSVTFRNLGQVPFAQKTTVNVDVAPVPGEKTTTNNKASYPVIFSLG